MERLYSVIEDVRAIKEALLGSELRPEGALDRLNNMERRLVHLERLFDRSRYLLLAVILSAFGSLYESVIKLIQLF